jgi:hypothetical protein
MKVVLAVAVAASGVGAECSDPIAYTDKTAPGSTCN